MKLTKEQLAALSPEAKLRLLDLIEEKKRRKRDRRESFEPNEGQLPVLLSNKTLRAVFAGNGGGKTALGINIALAAASGVDPWRAISTPVPCRIIVVLDKPDKVDSVWLPEIKKWFPLQPEQLHKDGKPFISRITFDNGSFVRFMFHDQEPMSFESIETDLVIFDEPPPRHVYVALRRGGRTKGRRARFVIIGTPIAAPWMRTEIYEPWTKGELDDVECFRFGTAVNKANLADNYIAEFSSVLSEKEKRIRLHGEFFDLEGLALSHLFSRQTHLLPQGYEFDRRNPVVVAVDPHPNKKHVAVMLGAAPEGLVYIKEFAAKMVPRDFARALKKFYEGYRVIDIVCDSLGSGDMTGGEGFMSFIKVCNDEGVRMRATSYQDKDDEDWIQRIQDCLAVPSEPNNYGLRRPKLMVMHGNSGLIGDIETVQWVKYRNMDEYKAKLDIGSKDFLAALKYALATNLYITKGKDKAYYSNKAPYGLPKRLPKASSKRPQSVGRADRDNDW